MCKLTNYFLGSVIKYVSIKLYMNKLNTFPFNKINTTNTNTNLNYTLFTNNYNN